MLKIVILLGQPIQAIKVPYMHPVCFRKPFGCNKFNLQSFLASFCCPHQFKTDCPTSNKNIDTLPCLISFRPIRLRRNTLHFSESQSH
jgi:hypothetical protein